MPSLRAVLAHLKGVRLRGFRPGTAHAGEATRLVLPAQQAAAPKERTLARENFTQCTQRDMAVMMGICKALLIADEDAVTRRQARVLDAQFIADHTHGFLPFCEAVHRYPWSELEERSGLPREVMVETAQIYGRSKATIACYGMGLTQHETGVANVQMLMNLLLLRGNIGKPGAGICPVRGHSNIQGQRTVGVGDKPEHAPLDKLAAQYGFEPPREKGYNTVEACEAVLEGKINGFLSFGGNFIRATPERTLMEKAWRSIPLTVYVATKLNHGHLVHGKASYVLPCLGRIEIDRERSGRQWLTVEDATSRIHASRGFTKPASKHLLSEPKIVAELAKATLPSNTRVPWDAWADDYSLIRNAIAETLPEIFHDFNERMHTPGGFSRPLAARERRWNTETGKANFILPKSLKEGEHGGEDGVLQLITLRSNDQFNTTIYSYDDRYRGVYGSRDVVLMNRNDLKRLQLNDGDIVDLTSAASDTVKRIVPRLRATAFDIPEGCCAGYFPDCNPLMPVSHYAEGSKTPAAKSIAVRVTKVEGSAANLQTARREETSSAH
jgi:molybdopterin-dependent oxidoreductase alpha subunit